MTASVTSNLELLSTAPEGIQLIREVVWDLAVRGLLTGDTADSWRRLSLGDLGQWGSGGTPLKAHAEYYGGDIPWLVIGDLNDGLVNTAQQCITALGLANSSAKLVPAGTVLIAMYGSIGKLGIAGLECATNQAIAHCQPDQALVSTRYLFLLLRSMRSDFLARGQGLAQQNISQKILKAVTVGLPALGVQSRIVAKVDELMALCDRLEARQQDAEAAHARLVQALLDSLTQARDADEFQACWQRLETAFAEAFTSEAHVEALAQAVRTLAFRGAMSRDGAADWKQVRVNDAVQFLNGYAFKSEWFVPLGIRLVRNVNIAHGSIDWRDAACIPAERSDEFAAFALKEGDVLLTLDRPIISTGLKVAVVRAGDLPCLLLQRVARLTPREHLVRAAYLLHWLRSPLFIDAIDPGRSNGVPHISTKQVGSMTIPLPALDEQDRIVARLDELLALCDQLKARITAARAKHAQLAEALVAQAVAA